MLDIYFMLLDQKDQDEILYLWETYHATVYNRIRSRGFSHEDTEDLLSHTYTQMIRYYDTYRGRPERVQSALLKRIADNAASTFITRKRKIQFVSTEAIACSEGEDIAYTPEETSPGPDEIVMTRDTFEFIKQVIREMDAMYRDVFALRYYHELSFEKIGEILEISPQTARKRFERGRKMIRAKVEEYVKDHE